MSRAAPVVTGYQDGKPWFLVCVSLETAHRLQELALHTGCPPWRHKTTVATTVHLETPEPEWLTEFDAQTRKKG